MKFLSNLAIANRFNKSSDCIRAHKLARLSLQHCRQICFIKDHDYLLSMRQICDPEIDKYMEKEIQTRNDTSYSLMKHLSKLNNSDTLQSNPDSGIVVSQWELDYYNKPIVYPSWYDKDRVIRGQEFANKHLFEICIGLMYYSLPYTYAFRGAKTLILSEQLSKNVNTRTLRSLQFIQDMYNVGSFLTEKEKAEDEEGIQRAIRTCQTIRIIHSSARMHHKNAILEANGALPINQLEQYLTLYGAFCWFALEAIEKLGANYNDDECKDFVYLWSIIGYFMGIKEELLLKDDDIDDINKLRNFGNNIKWWAENKSGEYLINQDTIKLSKVLIDAYRDSIPGDLFDDCVYTFWRYFLGDEYCDQIGIAKSTQMGEKVLEMNKQYYRIQDKLTDDHTIIRTLLHSSANSIIAHWFKYTTNHKRVPFYVDNCNQNVNS